MTDEETPTPKGTDYSKSKKRKSDKDIPEKNIQKIVTGEVIVQKQGVGKKIKDLFVAADFRTVMNYVAYDVLIPAVRNMIVDGATRGVERMMFGENRFRRSPLGMNRGGTMSRYTYQTPVNREREDWRDPRTSPPMRSPSYPRPGEPDFFLRSEQEANDVLDEMYNILSVFEQVSVGDLKGLIGLESPHTDQKWGWTDLRGVTTRQERAGWVIDLPRPEPLPI